MTIDPFALTPLLIPPDLIPALARRHRETVAAVVRLGGYRPMGMGADVLVRRVVARAVADHRCGVLERVCEPLPFG